MKLTINGKPPELRIVSRADVERAIATPGIRITPIQHWQPQLVGVVRTPKVTLKSGRLGIQKNGYYFDGIGRDGKLREMWMPLPKASEMAFYGDNRVTFYPGSDRCWMLRFELTEA